MGDLAKMLALIAVFFVFVAYWDEHNGPTTTQEGE